MTKTFTLNDVVRYLYDEIPQSEKSAFENALLCDKDLLNLFHEIRSVKDRIDRCVKSPSNQVIENILDYSKSLNLHSVKK